MPERFGEEFYQLVDEDSGESIIVDSDGVIVETNIDNPLLLLAQRRHDAKTQVKAYEEYLRNIDRVFLKNQSEPKFAYGDTVISIKGGRYSTLNGEGFADLVWEVVSGDPNPIGRLLAVIAAGTGFRADPDDRDPAKPVLEPAIAAAAVKCREWHEKKQWVESSVARRPAPAVRIVPNPELRDEVPA